MENGCNTSSLKYAAIDKSEFGITPVNKPLDSGGFSSLWQVREVVLNVHMAFSWRAASCKRDRQQRKTRVLIDFDSPCQFLRWHLRSTSA